ncbi:MAG: XRE family transcriptional regulator [Trueperaceae bacterium]|nr:XRE family transcriptional regulator [Trueperaceae bacterium]
MIAEVRAHKLAEIRRESGLNQEEMAERLNISQSRVSRIERGQLDKAHVATLKAYIEALGGELELSARFGSERISLG